MARALSENQSRSSVFRLLDPRAAASAVRPIADRTPVPARIIQNAVPDEAGPAPKLRFDAEVSPAATEIQTLLEHYGYLYGTRPELSFGFRWFSRGRAGAGTSVPPLFAAPASGKLMLEAAILLSYARSEGLPLFVVDPDGRFAGAVRSHRAQESIGTPAHALVRNCCEAATVFDTASLLFDRWDQFERLLAASAFFEILQIRTQRKLQSASALLVSRLRAAGLDLELLHDRSSFEAAWRHVADESFGHAVYTPGGTAAARLAGTIESTNREEVWSVWARLSEPFRRHSPEGGEARRSLASLIEGGFRGCPKAVIFDLSTCPARDVPWNDDVRGLLVQRLLDCIQEVSASVSSDGKVSNALVAVQETRARSVPSAPGATLVART